MSGSKEEEAELLINSSTWQARRKQKVIWHTYCVIAVAIYIVFLHFLLVYVWLAGGISFPVPIRFSATGSQRRYLKFKRWCESDKFIPSSKTSLFDRKNYHRLSCHKSYVLHKVFRTSQQREHRNMDGTT